MPKRELNIAAYPDFDFAGLWGHSDSLDPTCVRSQTGFVINFANCPVLWKSTLHSLTATSTMEAEVVALVTCCRELMLSIDLVESVGKAVGLGNSTGPKIMLEL